MSGTIRTYPFATILCLFAAATPAIAGDVRGTVDLLGVLYPTLRVGEGRARALIRFESDSDHWFVVASAAGDGLAAEKKRGSDVVVRPYDTYVERRGQHVEVRVGISNLAWGVLDEVSPQDVVNPLDVSRFVLESRSEARLPVPMVRTRIFLPAEWSIEAVVVPYARRGRFDQLEENRSPFAPQGLSQLPRSKLDVTAGNFEGGLRIRTMTRGIDWGVSTYRDVVDFDRYELSTTGLVATRPRRWMAGGDLETVIHSWVVRADSAFFFDDPLQAEQLPLIVTHTSFQGGVGADREVGNNTLFITAIYSHVPNDVRIAAEDEVSLVAGLSRDYSRGSRTLRLFGVWNTSAGSGFGRATWSAEVVENLRLEFAGGAFLGQGGRILGRFADADFVEGRLRFYF